MKQIAVFGLCVAVFMAIVASGAAQQADTPQQAAGAQQGNGQRGGRGRRGGGPAAAADGTADARIWAGVFSAAQAMRGEVTYGQYCLRCHGANLVGGGRRGAPPLRDDRFWLDFENQPLAALLSKMQRTMPADAPGTLREEDYLDVLAYVLKTNAFPAGPGDLAAAGLDAMPIARQPGVPREVPNFGLVRVVGCLASSGADNWTLTRATTPVLTREETSTDASKADAATSSLGDGTIVLVDVARWRETAVAGRRVEVRGLLDKTTPDNRLDVLTLAIVADTCGR